MSSSFRLLTEEESAQIAEVSIDTIRKYRDCGLLDPIVKENQTFFQELDIRTLFYAKFKERDRAPEPEAPKAEAAEAPVEAQAQSQPEPKQPSEADTLRTQAVQMQAVEPEPIEEPAASSGGAERSAPVVEVVGQTDGLPGAGELVEMNKSLREQIQVLREERDWLRERIEKLEARSEREQMLLLSESENVRKLINTTRKGFWQRALPWLGN